MYNNFLKRVAKNKINPEYLSKVDNLLNQICNSHPLTFRKENLLSYKMIKEGIYTIQCVYIEGLVFNGISIVSTKVISDTELHLSKKFNKKTIGLLKVKNENVGENPFTGSKISYVIDIQQIQDYSSMIPEEFEFFRDLLEFITRVLSNHLSDDTTIDPKLLSNPSDELFFNQEGKAISTQYGKNLEYFIKFINSACHNYFEEFVLDYLDTHDFVSLELSSTASNVLSRIYNVAASNYFNTTEFQTKLKRDLAYLFKAESIDVANLSEFYNFANSIKSMPDIVQAKDEILQEILQYLPKSNKQPNYDYLQVFEYTESIMKAIQNYVKLWFNKFAYKLVDDFKKTKGLTSIRGSVYNNFCKLIYAKTPEEHEENVENIRKEFTTFKFPNLVKNKESLQALLDFLKNKETPEELAEELATSQLNEILYNLNTSSDPEITNFVNLVEEAIEIGEARSSAENEAKDKMLESDNTEKRDNHLAQVRYDEAEDRNAYYDYKLDKLISKIPNYEIPENEQQAFKDAVNNAMADYDQEMQEKLEKEIKNEQESKESKSDNTGNADDDVSNSIYEPMLRNNDQFQNFRSRAILNVQKLKSLNEKVIEFQQSAVKQHLSMKEILPRLFAFIDRSRVSSIIRDSLKNVLLVLNQSDVQLFNYLKSIIDIHIQIQEIFAEEKNYSDARKRINTELNRHRDLKFYFEYGTVDGNLANKVETVQPYLNDGNDSILLYNKFIQWIKSKGLYYDAQHNKILFKNDKLDKLKLEYESLQDQISVRDTEILSQYSFNGSTKEERKEYVKVNKKVKQIQNELKNIEKRIKDIENKELQDLVKQFNKEFNQNLKIDDIKQIMIGKEFLPTRVVLDPESKNLLLTEYFKDDFINNPKLQFTFKDWLSEKGYKYDITTNTISDNNDRPVSEDTFKKLVQEFNGSRNIKNLDDVNIMSANSISEAIDNLEKIYDYLNYKVNVMKSQLKLK